MGICISCQPNYAQNLYRYNQLYGLDSINIMKVDYTTIRIEYFYAQCCKDNTLLIIETFNKKENKRINKTYKILNKFDKIYINHINQLIIKKNETCVIIDQHICNYDEFIISWYKIKFIHGTMKKLFHYQLI